MLMIELSCFCDNDVKLKSFDVKSRPKPVFVKEQLGAEDSGVKAYMKIIEDSYHIFLSVEKGFVWDEIFPEGVKNYRIVIEFVTAEMKKAAELQISFADFVEANSNDANIIELEKKLSIGQDYSSFAANYLIVKLKGNK